MERRGYGQFIMEFDNIVIKILILCFLFLNRDIILLKFYLSSKKFIVSLKIYF